MKSLVLTIFTLLAFLLAPMMVSAQTYQSGSQASGTPPIAQPLVREGTLAVKLVEVLHLGNTTSEVDAESMLSTAGIAPRNGWIADYPVTPDIVNELRTAVENAVTAGTVTLAKDDALVAFDNVMSQYNLDVAAASGTAGQSAESPDPTVINNYYYDEGPPAVTYYAPPVDYAYLYSWVPYPFWWWGFWFPGFFVLADFDFPIFVGGHVFFCSNHFFDADHHRFVRVNAFDRFHDFHNRTTFANRVVAPSTTTRAAQTVFRTDRTAWTRTGSVTRDNRSFEKRVQGTTARSAERGTVPNRTFNRGSSFSRPTERSPRTFNAPSGVNRSFRQPMANNRSFDRGLAMTRPAEMPHSSLSAPRSFSAPYSGGRAFSAPAPMHAIPSVSSGRSFSGFNSGGRSFGGFSGGFGGRR